MMMTRLIAVTAFAITAAVATTSTASAAPEQADPHHASALETEILPGIHYTASIVDKSVVLTTDGGSLTTQGQPVSGTRCRRESGSRVPADLLTGWERMADRRPDRRQECHPHTQH